MRIIGGFLRSRRLAPPPRGVRPTSDRVREALFARLGELRGKRILDLYAGTGALGIEAISRGAESAVFVDRTARSLQVLRMNLSRLGISDSARVLRGDVCHWVRRLGREGQCFDLVFLDPPYASQEARRAEAVLLEAGVLAAGATVVLEMPKRHSPAPTPGLVVAEERGYGDTAIAFLVVEGECPDSGVGDSGTPATEDAGEDDREER